MVDIIDDIMELAYRIARENEVEYRVEFTKDLKRVVITFENHFDNQRVSKMFDIEVLSRYSVREAFEKHLEGALRGLVKDILG